MSGIKNLGSVSKEELQKFVNSFDFVFFDIDGVLFLAAQPVPGAQACVEKLRKLNKKVVAVTNNTVFPIELLERFLKPLGFTKENIVTPIRTIIEYLQKIAFNRKLFVIGSKATKKALMEAGYKLVEFEPEKIEEAIPGAVVADIKSVSETKEDIGAVIIDMDCNFQLMQAQRAIVLLSTRKDLLFLSGMSDYTVPISKNIKVLGPKFIQDAVETVTQKQSIKFAKPSEKLEETLNRDFEVTDPKRVLFIGDSIVSDMSFATMCGYQKLLVLTGSTKKEDLENWAYSEENKPDYYLNGVQDFNELLGNLTTNQ